MKWYPGYQRFFSRAAGIFGVGRRPKPRAGHYKDLTEARNRARKVSGTQGNFLLLSSPNERTIIYAAMQSCHTAQVLRNITSTCVINCFGVVGV